MIFIDACYCRKTPRPPIWMMRQAGRYLPEYREIRKNHSFLEMCETPELVKEVTLQPIRRFGMDAAIIFCDILVPLVPMGLDLSYQEGEGPVIGNPIRTLDDVKALKDPDLPKEVGFLKEALKQTRAELDPDKALIGFAGAPFTLACYAVQGRGGKNFEVLHRWMFNEREAFDTLMSRLADMTIEYFRLQVAGGAQAIQLFESWGGLISAYDYLHRVFPHVQRILASVKDLGVPRILFIKGAGHFRNFLNLANAEVIGLDWTMPIEDTRRILGKNKAIQGNLDPSLLFASHDLIRERTLAMIEVNHGQPGYIANLGHGIHKDTPIPAVETFINTVKNYNPEE
ncbi:MAG: uroporphyrinogen decarboxylase [Acidobacteriota bacterium]|nr:uroporphyrinogen decarboxylase [Acidobacteriota bacterium]